jgi:hypothetical protein
VLPYIPVAVTHLLKDPEVKPSLYRDLGGGMSQRTGRMMVHWSQNVFVLSIKKWENIKIKSRN